MARIRMDGSRWRRIEWADNYRLIYVSRENDTRVYFHFMSLWIHIIPRARRSSTMSGSLNLLL